MPFPSPPIRSNDRMHWAKKAKLTRQVRAQAAVEAQRDGEKFHIPVMVTLIWEVPDRRVRDVGASAPTLKAILDGLVDAGMLPADDHRWVTRESYGVRLTPGRRAVVVEIEPDLSRIEST